MEDRVFSSVLRCYGECTTRGYNISLKVSRDPYLLGVPPAFALAAQEAYSSEFVGPLLMGSHCRAGYSRVRRYRVPQKHGRTRLHATSAT